MLEKKYYKQDLCVDAGRCKLYNPLLTQGQCEYYNKMCELSEELAIYKRALELACYYMEYEYPKQDDDIYYRKAQELEMIFIKQAKEKLEK